MNDNYPPPQRANTVTLMVVVVGLLILFFTVRSGSTANEEVIGELRDNQNQMKDTLVEIHSQLRNAVSTPVVDSVPEQCSWSQIKQTLAAVCQSGHYLQAINEVGKGYRWQCCRLP